MGIYGATQSRFMSVGIKYQISSRNGKQKKTQTNIVSLY